MSDKAHTVRVPADSRPDDWAAKRAAAMHAINAARCDHAMDAEADKELAAEERAAAGTQRQAERRNQRAAWKAARKARRAAA